MAFFIVMLVLWGCTCISIYYMFVYVYIYISTSTSLPFFHQLFDGRSQLLVVMVPTYSMKLPSSKGRRGEHHIPADETFPADWIRGGGQFLREKICKGQRYMSSTSTSLPFFHQLFDGRSQLLVVMVPTYSMKLPCSKGRRGEHHIPADETFPSLSPVPYASRTLSAGK